MLKISKFFYLRTSLVYSLVLTLAMILYASLVMGSQSECISEGASGEVKLAGLRIGYGYEDIHQLFSSLSDSGLECYARLLNVWDNVFPLIYGSMYIFWLSLIYRDIHFKRIYLKLINLYPLLPMIMDFIENRFEYRLVSNYMATGEILHANVEVASVITQLKWGLSTLNYLIILIGIAILLWSLRSKRNE